LAIFTAGAHSEKAGDKLLADLSAAIYAYMEQYRKEKFRPALSPSPRNAGRWNRSACRPSMGTAAT
jgi:hypothetical protein